MTAVSFFNPEQTF